jgi:hypothetical protein
VPALSLRRPLRRSTPDFGWPFVSRISYVLWRRRWKGGLTARARAFWHHVVRGYRYEICDECGRPVGLVWLAADDLWLEVSGTKAGVRCISCFNTELEKRGVFVSWRPTRGV